MTKQERSIMGAVIAFVLSVISLAAYLAASAHTHCGTVVSVGGCSHDGFCGLMLNNGVQGNALRPVIGQNTCVRCRQKHEVSGE